MRSLGAITRSPQLDNLNYEFDTITAELAREDSNLRPLIANLDTTLGALAVKESALQGTLVHAGREVVKHRCVWLDSIGHQCPSSQGHLRRYGFCGDLKELLP